MLDDRQQAPPERARPNMSERSRGIEPATDRERDVIDVGAAARPTEEARRKPRDDQAPADKAEGSKDESEQQADDQQADENRPRLIR
ncbi:MAG TPA: hypothetical protein VGN94_12625, partial [Methylobacterium sp.]|nr:hypothetical protein [Methylobacterium sp.]